MTTGTAKDRIRWLESDELARWDAFVENHPSGCISQHSGWKRVLERSCSHVRGQVLAAVEGDRIRAGLAVYAVRSRLLGTRIVSVPFGTLSTPLLAADGALDELLPPILELRAAERASRVELRAWRWSGDCSGSGFGRAVWHKHHYVPLDAPPESIRNRFSRTALRQMLSKAEKQNFIVSLGSTPADLAAFYRLFLITRRKLGLPSMPYRFFQALWEVYGPSKCISLVLIRHGSRTAGAVLALKFRDVYVIEFSGDLEEFRHVGINQFLYWQALRNACEEGYKVFSFGRTSPENTGLMAYKARWGAQVEDLPVLFYPGSLASDCGPREGSASFRLVRALCRALPLPAYRLMGGFLYAHLG